MELIEAIIKNSWILGSLTIGIYFIKFYPSNYNNF